MALGDASWVDYAVDVEFQKVHGEQGVMIAFRCGGAADHYQLNLGADKNKHHALECRVANKLTPLAPPRAASVAEGRWYHARVEVDGDHIRCLLDGETIAECRDDRYRHGGMALRTWRTAARFRNLRVTARDGTLLIAGLPRLGPAPGGRTLAELDERLAVLRRLTQ